MVMSLDRFYARHSLGQGGTNYDAGAGYLSEYIGFDSFEGFPEGTQAAEHPLYKAGHTRTEVDEFIRLIKCYGQPTNQVQTVSGFYSNSLNSDLAQAFRTRGTIATLVTIDCNLYESYRDVLVWLDEFLVPGSVVYLDDFNSFRAQPDKGPRRAWNEFESCSRWQFDRFLDVGWWGRSFIAQSR